ncbi:MAG: hypothetical protein R3F46_16600 [bacterium]
MLREGEDYAVYGDFTAAQLLEMLEAELTWFYDVDNNDSFCLHGGSFFFLKANDLDDRFAYQLLQASHQDGERRMVAEINSHGGNLRRNHSGKLMSEGMDAPGCQQKGVILLLLCVAVQLLFMIVQGRV